MSKAEPPYMPVYRWWIIISCFTKR